MLSFVSDTRFGMQAQTVSFNFPKAFQITDKVFVGMTGLGTDVQTLTQSLKSRTKMYELEEGRDISPKAFSSLVSHVLYERR